jgi:hypothetical protein
LLSRVYLRSSAAHVFLVPLPITMFDHEGDVLRLGEKFEVLGTNTLFAIR